VKIVLGVVLGFLLAPCVAYLYFAGGMAPVATTDSDMPFERILAHKALQVRLAKEMPNNIPVQANEGSFVAGAELYTQHCAVCHGLPLVPKSAIATGMYPHPPRLLEGTGVTDDEAGETYWKIFNGIRLTGMPGFSKSLSETQMWQIALMLKNADKLPPSAKTALVAPSAAATPPAIVSPVPPPPTMPSSTPTQK
jgi:thiosulfate dehydrogenase